MTFLEMVRKLAATTQCDPVCTAHTREAAEYLGAILQDEEIMRELAQRAVHEWLTTRSS